MDSDTPPPDTTPPAIPPVVKKQSATERIHSKLLGAGSRETLVEFEGETYLLIAPSMRQTQNIVSKAVKRPKGMGRKNIKAEDMLVDNAEIQVQALIICLRDNDTKEPVFTQVHRDALLDGPFTPLLAALGKRAAELLNPNIKAAKKNSGPTPGE